MFQILRVYDVLFVSFGYAYPAVANSIASPMNRALFAVHIVLVLKLSSSAIVISKDKGERH